ncbi:MAG: DUF222 domain-containing protein [Halioglobus sp.]
MPAPINFPPESSSRESEKLGEKITLLAGQINAASYQFLKLIARFDDCKGWSGGGTVRSCAHWLNWQCGIAMGAAREKVRVANCLENLTLINNSFSKGEISYSKVRAMTRVATPENEDFLLMIAQHGTASHMEQVVRKYQGVQRTMAREAELDQAEADQQEQRELVFYQDSDGMWVIHARLPAEEGSMVVKAIKAVAHPVQEEKREQLLQEGKGVSAGTDSKKDERNRETFPQSRADALVAMAEHFLATQNGKSDIHALKGSERCQIMLHVDINTLQARQHNTDSGPECCHLDNKQWISPKTARRLACDASLVTVLEDETGKVLNIGRRARTVPASIRRALSVRDETCRFPGCCESRFVDAHHIEHWADGGETSLDNLVTLCRYHHRKLHQESFSVRVDQANTEPLLVFSLPSGREIISSFFPQFPAESSTVTEDSMHELAPAVDTNTCIPHWHGDSCDYGMAVDALLQLDRGTA